LYLGSGSLPPDAPSGNLWARLEKFGRRGTIAETLHKEEVMKSQDKAKNEEKKKPQKTLKEKRAEKKAKKDSKSSDV
jgi:hypothetical protein